MKNEQKNNVVPIKKSEPVIQRKPRKRLTLTTPDRVRTYIQGLMIAVENDSMTESKARLLTNQAEAIMKAINAKETERNMILLEQRLIELEEKEK